jgi:hypothetical protein
MAAKKEDSLSLQRLKAKIRKRNAKVMSESKRRRLVQAKLVK